jgi:hypothetical protein
MPRYFAAAVAALALSALCRGAAAGLGVPEGLTGEFFLGEEHTGAPLVTTLDPELSTGALTRAWKGSPPEKFNARWFGYLIVPADGRYTFSTSSDDGSYITIDGNRILDNGGPHELRTRRAGIQLSRGPHALLFDYTQYTGGYQLEWTWARDGQPESPVPSWLLSPRRGGYGRILAARGLGFASWFLAIPGIFLLAAHFVERPPRIPAPTIAALPLFLALAVVHTWPLATDPAHLSRNDNGDTVFNEWVLAWVTHQAPRDLRHLFDANILYPERSTLAFSDALIFHSILAAPILWLNGSPVLAYNLVLIAGFTLSGWAMAVVVRRWTGSWVAGLTAGMIFGINGHTLTRLPHLQAQHGEFLPLAMLAFDGMLRQPGTRAALQLGAAMALQGLTSIYLLVFTTVALIAAALSRPAEWIGSRIAPLGGSLAIAIGCSALVLAPVLLPYWRASREHGFTRAIEGMSFYAVNLADFLATPARIHMSTWSAGFFRGNAYFPGALALLLAAVAVVSGVAFRDSRARMCLAAGVAGMYLSFGTKLPGYAWLYRLLPLLQAVRQVARFGYLVIFAAAALAGFGVIVVHRRVPSRAWPPLAAALLLVAAFEPLAAPLGFTYFDRIPDIYQRVPRRPGVVIAELPFYSSAAVFLHAPYMLNSTANWQPLVNGYSGFLPPSFYDHARAFAAFPQQPALDALRRSGVTHLYVHADQFPPGVLDGLERAPGVRKIESEGKITLYALE